MATKRSEKQATKATQPVSAGLPHVPSLYGLQPRKEYLPWSHAEERLSHSRNYWICTSRPDGRPHSIPVWGFWIDGALYFGTGRSSRKGKNLASSPAVSVHLESGDDVVILEGTAEEVSDKATLHKIDEASRKKYDMPLMIMPGETVVYCVRPRMALAWRERETFLLRRLAGSSSEWRAAESAKIDGAAGTALQPGKPLQYAMTHLFDSLTVRDITFPNRLFVSPMCQYSSTDGLANDWHFVHLGSRAVGGAGLVLTEAAAVLPEGRISPQDLGIWKDDQVEPLARIVRFIHEQGSVAGMQLAHAGRKASTYRPGDGHGAISEEKGGWAVVAPSKLPFAEHYPLPHALSVEGIEEVVSAFAAAAGRACEAGFRVIEIHAAHGYLIHEFLSPLSNLRTDAYGGSFENRTRILREIAAAVRSFWPEAAPLFVRISATDWIEGGWDLNQSVELARQLKQLGVDLIDCSSGGNVPHATIPIGAGYQTPFAERIRREANILTGAVGMITNPVQAEHIVTTGQADVAIVAREFLRDPYLPLRAARELGQKIPWPLQYLRAAPAGAQARQAVDLSTLESCFEEQHAIPER
jgi:2,4-dienoyl-CoA reductase-like NADH-dependent reductase (Old Yellow Enzyme family)